MVRAVRSSATVPTSRPARYGKQLTEHLGHKRPAVWNAVDRTGTVTFDNGEVTLTSTPDALELVIYTEDTSSDDVAELERMEHVVGVHLVRFGVRDALVVRWIRSDGSAGTEQS